MKAFLSQTMSLILSNWVTNKTKQQISFLFFSASQDTIQNSALYASCRQKIKLQCLGAGQIDFLVTKKNSIVENKPEFGSQISQQINLTASWKESMICQDNCTTFAGKQQYYIAIGVCTLLYVLEQLIKVKSNVVYAYSGHPVLITHLHSQLAKVRLAIYTCRFFIHYEPLFFSGDISHPSNVVLQQSCELIFKHNCSLQTHRALLQIYARTVLSAPQ